MLVLAALGLGVGMKCNSDMNIYNMSYLAKAGEYSTSLQARIKVSSHHPMLFKE